MADYAGARPRNVEYYLQRMLGYSKNTIRILPQSKPTYNPGDTVIFKLPTNSILDLHRRNMKFPCQLTNAGSNAELVALPRFTQSFIRRCDVTMGGMQTGLGSLHDYGALYHLMGVNKIPSHRSEMDLRVSDRGGYITGNDPITTVINAGTSTAWYPQTVSSWLGVLGGQFMRFLVSRYSLLRKNTKFIFLPISCLFYTCNTSLSRYSLLNVAYAGH